MVLPIDYSRAVYLKMPYGQLQYDEALEKSREAQYQPLMKAYGGSHPPHDNPTYFGEHTPFKRCYNVALAYACEYCLVYVEGFIVVEVENRIVKVGHAFCLDDQRRVHDPSLRGIAQRNNIKYEGIAISKAYVAHQAEINGFVGVLDGYPDGTKTAIYSQDYEIWRPKWTN